MVDHISAQTILIMVVVALVFSSIGFALSPWLLRLIGAGDDIFSDANRYLRISYMGLVLSYSFIVFQSLLRGIGEVRFPLYVISVTVVLNAIFDPLFIFGWGPVPAFGVAGAAWATVATQGIAAVIGIGVLFTGRYSIHLKWRDFIPDAALIRRAVLMGLPASLEQSNRTVGTMLLIFLVTAFGTLAVAAFGIGMRIMSFVFIPAFGMAMATTTLVGQNIGAGNIRRAEQAARLSGWVAFWFLSGVAVLFFIFAADIVRFFVPEDEALVAAGAGFVHITAVSYGVIGGQQVLLGAFRGAGDTRTAMMFSLITQWVFQFPLSFYLCRYTSLGVTGVWWGFPIANILATILTIMWFRKGRWKELNLTQKEKIN
jgi:putative MATE family efflux protein